MSRTVEKSGRSMLEGAPWRSLLRFALPVMGANVLQQLYNTVDTLVVGNFESQNALSAVGSCAYLTMFYLAFAMGFSNAAGVLTAQRFGAGDEKGMKKVAGTGIVLLLGAGAFMTLLAMLTNGLWLRYVIRVPEQIIEQAGTYIAIYCLGFVFQCGYNVVAFILRAVGDSRSSLFFLLITSVLNIALDLLFVAVFKWGVAGVAVATIISQFVSMIVSFIYMLKKHPVFRPDRESLRFDSEIAKDILRIGTPIVLQQMVISCGFMLLQNIVNGFGANMTASYTVACRLEIYMLVPGGAFTQAMAVYAGQNYGARRIDRIRKGLGQAVLMAEITALLVAGVVLLLTRQFVGLFALEESAAAFCVRHLHAVCLGILINAGYSAVNGVFQGVGRTKISMTSSIIELSNRLIWAMILKNILFEAAVWWNEPPAFFLAGLFSYLCFMFYKKWQEEYQ